MFVSDARSGRGDALLEQVNVRAEADSLCQTMRMEELGMKIFARTRRFCRSQDGATAIEYGLIAALLSVVIIAAVTKVGTELSSTFNVVATSMSAANN
jgi:pilus assembly protein Flp/PilA